MRPIAKNEIAISGLSKSMADALIRNANRRGMSVGAYVKELIAEDLELDRVASTRTFAELATPFQKSLRGMSDVDLDKLARPGRAIKRKR